MSVLSRLARPTQDTPFHIDISWWKSQIRDFDTELREIAVKFGQIPSEQVQSQLIDWIDPVSAEVTQINGLQYHLQVKCSQHPEFITENMTLVDAVFRAFLKNGNSPLSPKQLAEYIGRPNSTDTILRTFGGRQVYKGIRPVG